MSEYEDIIDFDFDAKEAQLREAANTPTVIKFRGEHLSFPSPKLWGRAAMLALEQNDYVGWMYELLDEDVVDAITTDREILPFEAQAICEAIEKKNGLDEGKSAPSSGPRRKKRKR